jgi:hypothetical protein
LSQQVDSLLTCEMNLPFYLTTTCSPSVLACAMNIETADSIDSLIATMKCTKDVLGLVIDSINRDVFRMTIMQNALTPLCQLLDKVLIYILKLVQECYANGEMELPDPSASVKWGRSPL